LPEAAETLALREQFSTPEQQRETASAGMWVFLVTEVMLFGALFTAFTVYRSSYTQAFDVGSGEMELWLGAINTGVLICSSLTMALAVHSAESGKQRLLALFLLLTIVIGAAFLGIKFTEYYKHYQDHKVPGISFEQGGPDANKVQMFFVFYFIMTGLHAVHMCIGISILFVLWIRSLLGAFTAEYYTPIEVGGLYWHFIDIVWVFLYAIFYVPGLHMHV
jgi:cytochrome c oxidase subunit III